MRALIVGDRASDGVVEVRALGDGPVTLDEHQDRAARRIGAALTGVGKAMPEQVLAELGEITLDEIPAVLAVLDARLAAAGARLHRVLGLVGVRPATDEAAGLDEAFVREAWRRHLARVSLNVGQVNVLAKAVRGELSKPAGNDQAVKAAELINAGLLERTDAGGYRPSAAVAYSLQVIGD